jgi:nicotinamide-nucleotide amidase
LAWLPTGAQVLNPQAKMAGYQLVHNSKPIFFLPGIPSQMQQLLIEEVIPRLATWYSDPKRGVYQRLLRIFTMDELEVNKKIATLKLDKIISIGYYPIFPELHLCLTIRDKTIENPDSLMQQVTESVYAVLGDVIYGQNQDSMEVVVGNQLRKTKLKLAVAESCTGGLLSHKITKVPGSSAYYLGGITSYANSMKSDVLGINPELLQKHGAVSKEVAEAMAIAIMTKTGAGLVLSVTGIAGPDGGTPEKPVGTVYIGLATRETLVVKKFHFEGSREQIQEITAVTALDQIRRYLLALS